MVVEKSFAVVNKFVKINIGLQSGENKQ